MRNEVTYGLREATWNSSSFSNNLTLSGTRWCLLLACVAPSHALFLGFKQLVTHLQQHNNEKRVNRRTIWCVSRSRQLTSPFQIRTEEKISIKIAVIAKFTLSPVSAVALNEKKRGKGYGEREIFPKRKRLGRHTQSIHLQYEGTHGTQLTFQTLRHRSVVDCLLHQERWNSTLYKKI